MQLLLLQVTKALIDMENMFELLATKPRVQDDPDAATLQVSSGTVEFKQVRCRRCLHMPCQDTSSRLSAGCGVARCIDCWTRIRGAEMHTLTMCGGLYTSAQT